MPNLPRSPDLSRRHATELDELALPPGLPGSGRRRYAAAMWFHLNADLPEDVLEVFRALAMDDHADPLRDLKQDRAGLNRGDWKQV